MSLINAGLLALVAVSQVAATPFPEYQLTKRYDPGMCNNQSCIVANIAGNTGVPVSTDPADYPHGDTYFGDCCVITLNPAVTSLAYQFNPNLKSCPRTYDKRSLEIEERVPSDGHALMKAYAAANRAALTDEQFAKIQGNRLDAISCTPKMLLYAKGTYEPGALGVTVGPQLQSDLAKYSGWSVTGINYTNSISGDYCLGLPGGIVGKQAIESVAAACPKAKILVAGYSEGALVVRNGLGNSTQGRRVKGLLTFGDPFEGSPVKNYKGPIQVYCNQGDNVCKGQFDITAAHLSYNATQIKQAAGILNQMAG